MNYETIKVRFEGSICNLQIYRPDANNTINEVMIAEFGSVLKQCDQNNITILVLEGLPQVFCFGADFQRIQSDVENQGAGAGNPGPLYDIWEKLATGPFVTVAHVKGKANAGGIGFVAACDVVIADNSAQFSLSELLFGLMPACVLPLLIRRIGFQKTHYMTLMTKPVSVKDAHTWGLVDVLGDNSDNLLRTTLLRLRYLDKTAIQRYKRYMSRLNTIVSASREAAIAANLEVFSDPQNIKWISRYVETGLFPWQKD